MTEYYLLLADRLNLGVLSEAMAIAGGDTLINAQALQPRPGRNCLEYRPGFKMADPAAADTATEMVCLPRECRPGGLNIAAGAAAGADNDWTGS